MTLLPRLDLSFLPRSPVSRFGASLLLLSLVLCVAACKHAASPAADSSPPLTSEPAQPTAAVGPEHAEGRALYERRCGTCHELYAPDEYPAAAWPRYVKRYGPRSGLNNTQREKVSAYLQAAAGR